jgi:secretion/DNA translocation related CpaE-like protein
VPDRPLLVTADPELLDDLLRVCLAVGVEAQVAHDVPAARAAWTRAPLVVLGDDVARTAAGLPRRADVVLAGRHLDDSLVWQRAAAAGADSVAFLPGSEALLIERLAQYADGDRAQARTLAVIGGRGGAGASTLACALAVTAVVDRRTMLVDADPVGGGLDLVLGGEHQPGLRWPDLAEVGGRVNAGALGDALPVCQGVRLLSWDRGEPRRVPADSARAVLDAARRVHDVVVVDLPRVLDEAAEAAAAACDVVYLVVPAEVRAVAAASRVSKPLARLVADIGVVVRGPAPSGLTAELVAESLGLPLAGWLRPEPGLERSLERGDAPAGSGRGPLAALCRSLLDGLASARAVA